MKTLILIALMLVGCSGPIGLGSIANLTETVCVVPSDTVSVQDIVNAAQVWHDANERVNMLVKDAHKADSNECDTVVAAAHLGKDYDYACGTTGMDGVHIYLDLNKTGCDPLTVEPHELGHLLLGGEHSKDSNDLMYDPSWVYTPSNADLARLPK